MTAVPNLRGRAEAEACLRASMASGAGAYVLAVAIPAAEDDDRALGDVASGLAGDVFRWSAASLVVVSGSVRELRRIARAPGATCTLFRACGRNARALASQID